MWQHGFLATLMLLTLSLAKATLQALVVVYPSYKTYKALESRNLKLAHGMLVYWCIMAFMHSGQEIVDEILGTYANVFLWKFTTLALKAAPLLIGPERMYDAFVKPFYAAHEPEIDAVVDETHKIKSLAKEALPAVKSADMEGVSDKVSEIAAVIQEDVVQPLQSAVNQVSESVSSNAKEMGVVLDKEGMWGLMDRSMAQFERLRDFVFRMAQRQWRKHGPYITKHARRATNRGIELYEQHAPGIKAKAAEKYDKQIRARVQPQVERVRQTYSNKVKPFVLAKSARAQDLWVQHGGPVRTAWNKYLLPFYRNTLLPFYRHTLLPFIVHSLLPAIFETALSLQHRAIDLFRSPTEEMRNERAQHKRRRREVHAEAAAAKRKRSNSGASSASNAFGSKANQWDKSWKRIDTEGEMENETPAEEPAQQQQQQPSSQQTGLTHRKRKQSAGNEAPSSAAAAPTSTHPTEPMVSVSKADQTAAQSKIESSASNEAEGKAHESRQARGQKEAKEPEKEQSAHSENHPNKARLHVDHGRGGGHKGADQPGEKGSDWANEPRSGNIAAQ